MSDTSYDDIINLPRPVSSRHTPMPRESRAAQFAPFAALTGYGDSVKEEARLTGERITLTEEQENTLNAKVSYLTEKGVERPRIRITYFVADERKSGGRYVTLEGAFYTIDETGGFLVLLSDRNDKIKIPLPDILSIEGDIFTGGIFDAF